MTKYEKMVEEGTLVPMNGLDWLMLQAGVEDILKGDTEDEMLNETIRELFVCVEHFYHDDEETLSKLKTILNI
jgi:hypothetical protein